MRNSNLSVPPTSSWLGFLLLSDWRACQKSHSVLCKGITRTRKVRELSLCTVTEVTELRKTHTWLPKGDPKLCKGHSSSWNDLEDVPEQKWCFVFYCCKFLFSFSYLRPWHWILTLATIYGRLNQNWSHRANKTNLHTRWTLCVGCCDPVQACSLLRLKLIRLPPSVPVHSDHSIPDTNTNTRLTFWDFPTGGGKVSYSIAVMNTMCGKLAVIAVMITLCGKLAVMMCNKQPPDEKRGTVREGGSAAQLLSLLR